MISDDELKSGPSQSEVKKKSRAIGPKQLNKKDHSRAELAKETKQAQGKVTESSEEDSDVVGFDAMQPSQLITDQSHIQANKLWNQT